MLSITLTLMKKNYLMILVRSTSTCKQDTQKKDQSSQFCLHRVPKYMIEKLSVTIMNFVQIYWRSFFKKHRGAMATLLTLLIIFKIDLHHYLSSNFDLPCISPSISDPAVICSMSFSNSKAIFNSTSSSIMEMLNNQRPIMAIATCLYAPVDFAEVASGFFLF